MSEVELRLREILEELVRYDETQSRIKKTSASGGGTVTLESGKYYDVDQAIIAVEAYIAQREARAATAARVDEATKAWQNSCDMPNADAISRSLAGRRRHLEAELAALNTKSVEQEDV